jgi:hypothetical protein
MKDVSHFNDLLGKKLFAGVLVFAEERLKVLQGVYSPDELSPEARRAIRLVDESKAMLFEMEKKFGELFDVFGRLLNSREFKDAQVLHVLTGWLANVQKMKKGCCR